MGPPSENIFIKLTDFGLSVVRGGLGYTLIAGYYPWNLSTAVDKIYAQIKSGVVHYNNDVFSKQAQKCISNMLCVDTACRATAAEIKNHPWVNGIDNVEAPENAIAMMKKFARETKMSSETHSSRSGSRAATPTWRD